MGLCSLVQRNRFGIYEIRKRVPEDLQQILGRKTIKRSLGTNKPNEAKAIKARIEAELMELFENKRAELIQQPAPPAQATGITKEDRLHMVRVLRHMGLHTLEGASDITGSWIDSKKLEELKSRVLEDLRYSPQKRALFAETLKEMQKAFDTQSYNKQRIMQLLDQALHSGNNTAPLLASNATPKGANITLHGIFEKWAETKRRTSLRANKETGIGRYERLVGVFIQNQGDMLIESITIDSLLAFREHLKSTTDYKAKTINTYLAAVAAMVTFAANERYINSHPFKGIQYLLSEDDSEKWLPFEKEDLEKLFLNPNFAVLRKQGPNKFWIPLIALFTGARIEELCQLKQKDVKEEKEVYYFDINEDDDDKNVKTESSVRKVPIHPKLIDLGFLDYVRSLTPDPDAFIFADLKVVENRRAHGISKWFGDYKRKIGINKRRVFHSFRATLKDACRAAAIPRDMHQQLTGHASNDVGDKYGYGHHVTALAPNLAKVDYGIDFSCLKEGLP